MPTVALPVPHEDQRRAFHLPGKRKAIRCGRRWGKTVFGEIIAANGATKRQHVGWFAPQHNYLTEPYRDLAEILAPVREASSKTEGVYRTITGGDVTFWTLEDDRAGRGRRYHTVIIDEAAFTKPDMMGIWEKAIEPTLLDYTGTAIVLSNTNGTDPDNFFWRICNEPQHGFVEHWAPTTNNPILPKREPGESEVDWQLRRVTEFNRIKEETPPLIYAQEYEARFVNWAGKAFFEEEKLLVDGQPVEYPKLCDTVYAVIDSAVKQGLEHDGTAVSYWAYSKHFGIPLICLDWDILEINGAMLEQWVPSVFARCTELTRACKARMGVSGVFIEDAQSGTILLQQCANRGWDARALPSELTALGKDGRAINASTPVYQGRVKWSRHAYDKITTFHRQERNHMITQVHGFRMGDKNAAKRADDLLDTFTYSVSVALGDSKGFG